MDEMIVDDIYELETIHVQLDKYFKRKLVSRCRDEFLNTLCEENDEETRFFFFFCNDEVLNEEDNAQEHDDEDDKEYVEKSDEDYEEDKYRDLRFLKGYQICFKKCDSVRLIAICESPTAEHNCPFICRASWMSTEDSFHVKVLKLRHTCVRNYNNSALMNPIWLAKQFVKEIISKPNFNCNKMHAVIQSKFYCTMSWSKCYRARCKTLSFIEGELSDHYARVWGYRQELLRIFLLQDVGNDLEYTKEIVVGDINADEGGMDDGGMDEGGTNEGGLD
ncbi:hypothetical protein LXL04_016504 [Taraxacum kok-saghyz]